VHEKIKIANLKKSRSNITASIGKN